MHKIVFSLIRLFQLSLLFSYYRYLLVIFFPDLRPRIIILRADPDPEYGTSHNAHLDLSGHYANPLFVLQGQFKNTVKCSECGHVSVSFEPFMYLSVPLPRANDIQIEVSRSRRVTA